MKILILFICFKIIYSILLNVSDEMIIIKIIKHARTNSLAI